jgi:hypothetical protein
VEHHGDAANSEGSERLTLPNISCLNNNVIEKEAEEYGITFATSAKTIEDEESHGNSEGSWSDIKCCRTYQKQP